MTTRAFDFEYAGLCRFTKKYLIREQLYPESRGWIEHAFENDNDARDFLKKLDE